MPCFNEGVGVKFNALLLLQWGISWSGVTFIVNLYHVPETTWVTSHVSHVTVSLEDPPQCLHGGPVGTQIQKFQLNLKLR